jgi:hypothetical protein
MAWSYLQGAASTTLGSGNTTTVTFANNVVSGSKIIVFASSDSTSGTPSAPTSGGFTWTAVGAVSSGTPNGALSQQMFFLDTPASLVGTKPSIAVVFNASTSPGVSIIEVAGLLPGNTTACLDGVQATKLLAGASSEAQPAYTSTAAGEFLAVGYGDNGGPAIWTVPAGYNADNNGGTGIVGAGANDSSTTNNVIAYKSTTGGAEGTPNWTFTGSPTSMGSGFIIVAFKLAPSGASAQILPGQTWKRFFRRKFQAPPPAGVNTIPSAPTVTVPGSYLYPGRTWKRHFDPKFQPPSYPPPPLVDYYTNSYTSLYGGPETPNFPGLPPRAQAGQTWTRHFHHPQQQAGTTPPPPAPFNQATFYPLNAPVRARIPAPSWRGTCRTMSLLVTTAPVVSVSVPQGLVAGKSRGFPPRGRTRSGAGVFSQAGPAVTPLQRPVQARQLFPPRGRTAGRIGVVQGTGATFYPYRHPVAAIVRPLAGRGRTASRAGTLEGTGAPFYPLRRPATTAVRGFPQRGRTVSRAGMLGGTGAPFYPLSHPVASLTRALPPRGRAQGRAGTFTATAITLAVFYSLNHPSATPARGLPRRGVTRGNAGVSSQIGTAFYALNHPVQARRPLPPRGAAQWRYGTFTPITSVTIFYPLRHPAAAAVRPLPGRGRTTGRSGTFQGTGPAVTPLQRPVRTRQALQQPPPKGAAHGLAGIQQPAGSQFYPLRHPAAAVVRPLSQRGRAQGRAGVFTQVTQPGPPVYPLHSPVAAVVRPLPVRGRSQGHTGVFRGTGPAVKPLQRPVYAWRPGPRRGVTLTSLRPAPPVPNSTRIKPLQRPVQSRQPLPPAGRTYSTPPYAPPFIPAGGHAYPYQAQLTVTRWSASLTSTEWSADFRNPVRYSAMSAIARWPSALEAGRWFATSGPA